MMEQLFLRIANMSITASYCIGIVLVIRFLIRKLPKIYSYVLWTAVFFRLACPISFQSTLSLLRIRTQPIPQDIGTQPIPSIASGSERIDRIVNNTIQRTVPAADITASVNPMQMILTAAAVLWITGICLLLGYSMYSYLRLCMRLRQAVLLEEGIYEQENIPTPFVTGLRKPKIYLPPYMDEQVKRFVLEHEKTHIRRKDYLMKQAAFFLSCVHWFNPLVWISFYLMCRDMEMSCDESVLRRLGTDVRKEYSAALLSLSSGKKIILGSPLAFGERNIRSRIVNVLHYKKRAVWVSMIAVIVLAAVMIGLALNPKEDPNVTGETERADDDFNAPNESQEEDSENGEGSGEETEQENEQVGMLDKYIYYEGYMDEFQGESKRLYEKLDLDFDGMTDRVYRDLEGDTASFTIMFGNGEQLFIGDFENDYVFPTVSAAKITFDGNPMILFVANNIMANSGKENAIALYTKVGDNYEKMERPRSGGEAYLDASENRAGYFSTETYDAEKNKMIVAFQDTDYQLEFTPKKDVEEGYSWTNNTAYSAQFASYQGETCIVFLQNAGQEEGQEIFSFVLAVHPSERSGKNPYDLELLYVGPVDQLMKEGFVQI